MRLFRQNDQSNSYYTVLYFSAIIYFETKVYLFVSCWKNTHDLTLREHKNLYSIYVLNLNLIYGINMKQATIWIFQLAHDLNRIDCKIWACNLRACEWHVCELQAEQFRSCDLQLDQSVSFYWRVTQYVSCESYQSEHCFKFANEAR